MRSYRNNPRTISAKRAKQLKADLELYGDLGGIVHDLNSDQLVGGHQRLRVLFGELGDVFQVKDADIEIVRKFDEPDRQGTVAHGFVLWRGFRYAYRQVRWDADTFEAANIKANLDGGAWNWDIVSTKDAAYLQEIGFDLELKQDWDAGAAAIGMMLASEVEAPAAPDDFAEYDESIDTQYECPKCGYRWSGKQNQDEAG